MGLNVLIVDDSEVMRRIVARSLRLSGLPLGEVYHAANGEDGLRTLAENWVDLALVDINMPGMNGMEMIDRVRAAPETRGVSIIVVSTESSDTRVELIRQMGAGFVHKPFTPETLRETIQNLMGASYEQHIGERTLPGGGLDF